MFTSLDIHQLISPFDLCLFLKLSSAVHVSAAAQKLHSVFELVFLEITVVSMSVDRMQLMNWICTRVAALQQFLLLGELKRF